MPTSPLLFWFRQDLRISDNPGFFEAAQNNAIFPIYILDPADPHPMGAASRWWLHHSLEKLHHSLDGNLHFYHGPSLEVLLKIIAQQKIQALSWNRCYEPWRIKTDAEIQARLKSMNIECKTFNASLLWEPEAVLKSDGGPYQVFTPFYHKAAATPFRKKILPAPKKIVFVKDPHITASLNSLELCPKKKWVFVLPKEWEIGEKAAQKKCAHFLKNHLAGYQENRDYPGKPATSCLSPHLHFGEISPHQIWHATRQHGLNHLKKDADHFLRQLVWREFSYALLTHFPDLTWKNFQSKFEHFPWKKNESHLAAWQQGKTGYPIVDAGMRELWQTGTMHNRVRMIVASFLVKNLLIHWREGAAWFWDCLVDADLASNSVNWQWVAGCGVDPAPYFRIFNPVLQGKKFDPMGEYILRFVPELKALPKKFLFSPWEASEPILKTAGVILGKTYPHPIVDLAASRDKALEAYHQLTHFSY